MELFEFEEAKYKKSHGFTYKEITEKIAYLKNKYRSLDTICIEPSLEHFEVNQVAQRLARIENNLKYIDPLKENIWINFFHIIRHHYMATHDSVQTTIN